MGSVGLLTQLGMKVGMGVLLAVAAVSLGRRVSGSRTPLSRRRNLLRITGTFPLGQNRALHLVEAGTRCLLIGSTPGQIALLADLTGDESLAPEPAPSEPTLFPTGAIPFGARLAGLLREPAVSDAWEPAHVLREAAEALRSRGARP